MKSVAIYCRVDSGGSAVFLQEAIIMQKIRLEQFALENKYIVTGFYDDVGCSGCDLSRPGLTALESDYAKGKFDVVLVVNRSRLYRGNILSVSNWPFPVLALDEI